MMKVVVWKSPKVLTRSCAASFHVNRYKKKRIADKSL